MEIVTAQDPEALERALSVLEQGGLIVLPTDTVYGVGVRAHDEAAVQKLFELKQREANKPIPVLIAGIDSLLDVAQNLPPAAMTLARAYWPGPLTLVVEKSPDLPDVLTQGNTVGIRAPDHGFTTALLSRSGPLAVTSANISGQPSVRELSELSREFCDQVDLMVDAGPTPGGRASTVIDCTLHPIHLLREGPIHFQDLLKTLSQSETRSY